MSIIRCTTCNGSKKISPLGSIQKECPSCHGIGFVDDKPEKNKSEEKEIVRKRGRPPRNNVD